MRRWRRRAERELEEEDESGLLPPDQPVDAFDILGEAWLQAGEDGGHEREDFQVEVPTESPFVTAMREARGGPFTLAPDSADWVPPDVLATTNTKKVEETTRRKNKQLNAERVPEGQVKLPDRQAAYLRKLADNGDEAAWRLLGVLGRGLESSSPELEKAVQERRRRS
jgi:hypothetical protein